MRLIKTEEAVGHILCHDITQIIRGVTKDAVFRKGHVIRPEDVPVLLGGLGSYLDHYTKSSHLQWPQINRALQSLADREPGYGYVSAEGLTPNPDNLHFSAASLHAFGLRYYEAFRKLEDPDKVFVEKPDPDDALRTELDAL